MKNLIVIAMFCALIAGCAKDGPERVAVRGSVNVDGAPLPKGSIVFVPTGTTGGPKSAGSIENGTYAIPRDSGPVVGSVRVEILAAQDLGFALDDAEEVVKHANPNEVIPQNPIPPAYNKESTLVRHTEAGTENTFDFEIATHTEN